LETVTAAGAALGSLTRTLNEVEALALKPTMTQPADTMEQEPVSSRGLCIHGAQAAKLYGFTERFLTTRVDPLQPERLVPPPSAAADGAASAEADSLAGAEELIASVRRARKELVRRCNALLDAFERAKSFAVTAEVGTRQPDEEADGLALTVSLEDDFVSMVLTLRPDRPGPPGLLLRPASVPLLTATDSKGDVGAAVVGSMQLLSASGFLEGALSRENKIVPQMVVLSSAEPHAESVASAAARIESHLGLGVGHASVVLCHSHAAAAVAIAHCYLPAVPLVRVLVISASANAVQYSLMKYASDKSSAAGFAIDFIFHGQLQCLGSVPHMHGHGDSALPRGAKLVRRGGDKERAAALSCAPAAISRQIEDAGSGAWLECIDAVCFASMGSAALTAFTSLRLPLEKAFPGVPIISGFPDGGMRYVVNPPNHDVLKSSGRAARDGEPLLRALTVEDGLAAFGASLLARPGLAPRCLAHPLGTLIGIKSNLVRQSSRIEEGGGTFVSLIPFYHCSSAFGSSSTRSAVSLRSLQRGGGRATGGLPDDKLCLEIVEISMAGSAMDSNSASFHNSMWNSGYVCMEPLHVGKSAEGTLDEKGLFMSRRLPAGYQCRVLGRVPLDESLECSVLAGAEAVMAIELNLPEIGLCFENRNTVISGILVSVGAVDSGTSGSPSVRWFARHRPVSSFLSPYPAVAHSPPADCLAEDGPSHAANDISVEVVLGCKEDADVCKSRGNSAMAGARPGAADAAASLQSAVFSYSCGLQLDPLSAVLYSNRCAAQLQMAGLSTTVSSATASHASKFSNNDRDQLLLRSLFDATVSATLRPEWSKAHSRLGETRFRLGHLQAAVDAYTRAYECELLELQQTSPGATESMKNRGVGHSSILRALNEALAALDAERKQQRDAAEELRSESSKRPRKQGAEAAAEDDRAKGSSCNVS
jgi:hypothetical protein